MLHVFETDTVVRWHRQGFRYYWRWKIPDQVATVTGAPVGTDMSTLLGFVLITDPANAVAEVRDDDIVYIEDEVLFLE